MEAQSKHNHREEERQKESYREVTGTEEQVGFLVFVFFFSSRQGTSIMLPYSLYLKNVDLTRVHLG